MPQWNGIAGGVGDGVLHRGTGRPGTGRRAGARVRRGTGLVVHAVDHRVQLRVEPLDAGDRGVDQLERRHLLRAQQLGLATASIHAKSSITAGEYLPPMGIESEQG